jgi:hypothetical protein
MIPEEKLIMAKEKPKHHGEHGLPATPPAAPPAKPAEPKPADPSTEAGKPFPDHDFPDGDGESNS